jgi:uncharacterized protein YraI
MKLRSLAIVAFGFGLGMAAPTLALAYTNYTTSAVNQRTGPGTGYASLGALPAGTVVNVSGCQPGWCRASSFLGTGWISSSYLSGGQAYVQPYPNVRRYPYLTYRTAPYYPRVYPYYPRGYPYRPYLYPPRAQPYPYPYGGYGGPGVSLFFGF